jgi:ribosomal protein S18 acetylase RimI-like enzyme
MPNQSKRNHDSCACEVMVDSEDGRVVSSLVFYWVRLPSRYVGVIEEVKTLESYRRQGRATKLILRAIKKGRELGLDCIELTVREDSPNVQRFYQSLGFCDRLNRAYRLSL